MHSISSKNFKHFFSLNPTTLSPSLFSPFHIICIILRKVGDIIFSLNQFSYGKDKMSTFSKDQNICFYSAMLEYSDLAVTG